ncbi:MAG: hypothetical protein HC904_13435 [Blastochloris sp.]|nr:hypothetical protein [Blastochloris sp.]
MKVDSFRSIIRALNSSEVRYLLVGGLAVNAHGYVRSTQDVDLVLWLDPANLKNAFSGLAEAGYRPYQPIGADDFSNPDIREAWRREKGMVVLKMWNDLDPGTGLDIFVYEPFDFKTEYSRARIEKSGMTWMFQWLLWVP